MGIKVLLILLSWGLGGGQNDEYACGEWSHVTLYCYCNEIQGNFAKLSCISYIATET